jgi:chromosome segregation ATPase
MTYEIIKRIENLEKTRDGLRDEIARLKRKLEEYAVAMEGWRGALAHRDAEIERLTAVLREIAESTNHTSDYCRRIARTALGKE